jgi:hypothetical protein
MNDSIMTMLSGEKWVRHERVTYHLHGVPGALAALREEVAAGTISKATLENVLFLLDRAVQGLVAELRGEDPQLPAPGPNSPAPGDPVLDPFCGSGMTGEVWKEMSRRFNANEKQKRFQELAAKRLNAP